MMLQIGDAIKNRVIAAWLRIASTTRVTKAERRRIQGGVNDMCVSALEVHAS